MENEPKNLEAKTFQQKPCTDLDLGILQKKKLKFWKQLWKETLKKETRNIEKSKVNKNLEEQTTLATDTLCTTSTSLASSPRPACTSEKLEVHLLQCGERQFELTFFPSDQCGAQYVDISDLGMHRMT